MKDIFSYFIKCLNVLRLPLKCTPTAQILTGKCHIIAYQLLLLVVIIRLLTIIVISAINGYHNIQVASLVLLFLLYFLKNFSVLAYLQSVIT